MTITHVAIRFKEVIYSLPKPNRHHNVIRHIIETTGVKFVNAREDDQEFLVDGVKYCKRRPALSIALRNGQCKSDCLGAKLGMLFSEDIW